MYHAFDEQLGRAVTLSLAAEFDEAGEELRNEARSLAALQHSAIVNVLDIGSHSARTFAVFEHLPSSLERELRLGTLSIARVADILASVGEALDFVHRRGYLHRGIRPKNILLDSLGLPKLSGFEKAVKDIDFLPQGDQVETLSFMAPELLRGERLGPFTDIWAVGITMYFALTGRMPFDGDTTKELLQGILGGEPVPPTQLVPVVPPGLERVCLRCLRKAPKERYLTAQLFVEDLRAWQRRTEFETPVRIFISHSSQDRHFVESKIISPFETSGIRTWYSQVAIQTAAEWERSIKKGLESCEWFLIVLSKRSAESEWVKDELCWAIDNRDKHIIPIRIDSCEVTDFHIRLKRIQHIDFEDSEKFLQHLLQLIRDTKS